MTDPLRSALRLRLGAQLRVIRRRRGLSGPGLGRAIGISQSKVSRIERGELWPPLSDIAAWLEACYVDQAEDMRVMALAEAIEQGVTTWRDLHRGSLEVRQRELTDLDAKATSVRHFQPLMVPGLFHTPAYARGAIVAANLSGERDVDAAVAARMKRGERMRSPGAPAYHALVAEAALRYTPAGAEQTMTDQWQAIVDAAAAPSITMQIIPTGAVMTAQPTCAFVLFDFDDGEALAIVETPAAEITFTGDETAAFVTVFDRMAAVALSPAESVELVRNLIQARPAP